MSGPRKRPAGPDLQRHRHWRGQLLTSRDLGDQAAGEAERLWWHNRAVHDAYGVAEGLTVSDGAEGPVVAAGVAYDLYGRALELAEERKVRPPADPEAATGGGPGPVWLLLLAGGDAAGEGCGCGGCGCGCGGSAGSDPGPCLAWHPAGQVSQSDGVVLARGRWTDVVAGRDFRLDDVSPALPARRMAQPRIAAGSTSAGGTDWRPWSLTGSAFNRQTAVGLEVAVDTRAAGFTRTPCYFAWLQGGVWQQPWRRPLSLPIDRVVDPTRTGFTFSLWEAEPPLRTRTGRVLSREAERLAFARERLHVCWLGIEDEHAEILLASPVFLQLFLSGVTLWQP